MCLRAPLSGSGSQHNLYVMLVTLAPAASLARAGLGSAPGAHAGAGAWTCWGGRGVAPIAVNRQTTLSPR